MYRAPKGAAHAAFVTALVSSFAITPADAADIVVGSGTTENNEQVITGTDTLTVEKDGIFDVDGTAVTWESAVPGSNVTIVNSGTITTTGRGIDTNGDIEGGTITFTNNEGAKLETEADSFRIDTDLPNGKVIINNAGTIHAIGGQAFDFDAVESEDAEIAIHNFKTGIIVADDSDAINAHGGSITIINEGTISSVLSESRGIDIAEFDDIKSINIVNKEGATIEAFGEAIRVDSDGNAGATGTIVLDNAGLIVSRGISDDPGQAVDFDKVESTDAKITIYNRATGEIRGEADDAVRTGEGAAVHNWGKIIGKGLPFADGDPDDDMKADGIDVGEHSATIYNYAGGEITGDRHGITTDIFVKVTNEGTITGKDGSGVGSDGDGEVVNYGRITGAVNNTTANINGDGDGVDIDGHGEITNYGIIEGTGAKGIKDGSPNDSEGIAMGGGSINNAAAGALISGKDNGILVDDSEGGNAPEATTIANLGTIRGENGFGIKLIGTQADTLTNAGLIEGKNGLAADLGGGDDTLNVKTGSKFIGTVDGGAGTDVVTLDGTGSFAGGLNFENLIVKSGAWTLTGDQAYADGIRIEGGSLTADGAIGGTLETEEGSVLDGNGTFGSGIIGGTIAPGHSIGKITFTGNYQQLAGSTYAVEVDAAGKSDLIDVTGTADLDGTVVVEAAKDGHYALGTRYTILSAAGGITGGYTGVSGGLPFIDFALAGDANNVYLDATRNAVAFSAVAKTANQKSVANAAEALGAGNAVYGAVVGVTSNDAALAAFNSLSGEIHASSKTAMLEDSRFVRDAVTDRARTAPASGGVWGQAFGSDGSFDGDGNASNLDRSIGGVFVGADTKVGEATKVGVAAGYSQASLDDDRASSSDRDDYHVALYGGTRWGALGVRFGAAYTWHDLETTRLLALPGLANALDSNTDARTGQVFGEIGYGISTGATTFEPFAGIAYVNLDTDRFTEHGSAGALTSNGGSEELPTTTLGLRASTKFNVDNGTILTARGTLGWRHALDDVTPTETLAFAGGSAFTIAGVPVAEDSLILGAGFDLNFTQDLSVGLSYDGQIGDGVEDHGVKGNLSWKF